MEFIEIDDLKMCDDIRLLYANSFPIEEQVEFDKLFSGVFHDFKLFGLYKEGLLVGMCHFNETNNFIHLNYLAIDKKYQGIGCGTHILSWLKDKFNNKAINFPNNYTNKRKIILG